MEGNDVWQDPDYFNILHLELYYKAGSDIYIYIIQIRKERTTIMNLIHVFYAHKMHVHMEPTVNSESGIVGAFMCLQVNVNIMSTVSAT